MPHFTQSLCFDLADALPCDLELPADFFEGSAVSIDEPKSLLEHLPLTIRQSLQHVLNFLFQQYNGSHIAGIFSASILDKVAEICFFTLADGRLKRDWLLCHLQNRANAIHG